MVPIEWLWIMLIVAFGLIGTARGLSKEMGTSTVVMLSLFALWEAWSLVLAKRVGSPTVEAAFFGIAIMIVAFISYEGVVLSFPVSAGGLLKFIFGFLGGTLNGYLVVGTIWNAMALANYPKLHLVSSTLTATHAQLLRYLPLSVLDKSEFIFLVPGMFLLLLIVLK